jgi:hypothetical protein
VSTSTTAPEAWEGDLLFVPLSMKEGEDKKALAPILNAAAEIDKALGGALAEMVEENEFKGGPGSSATVRLAGGSKVKKVSLGLAWGRGRGAGRHAGGSRMCSALAYCGSRMVLSRLCLQTETPNSNSQPPTREVQTPNSKTQTPNKGL